MARTSYPRLLIALCLTAALAACDQKPGTDKGGTEEKAAPVTTVPPVSTGPLPTLAPMLQRASPAVVNISVQQTVTAQLNPLFQDPFFKRFFNLPDEPPSRQVQSVGSGVIYDAKNGYIVTNHHVVANADKIVVTLADRRELTATLVGADSQTDLAVLKVENNNLTALPVGDSTTLQVGDYVVAIGNPFGVGQTATFGIVSALSRAGLGIEQYEDFIQTDASINPGNSGGALIDLNGNLVGINTAILSRSGGNVGIGFAIPINMAKDVVTQLIAHGKVTRGQLGVVIQDLTPPIAEAMNLDSADGALISRVMPASAAAEAGLKSGDVITAVDGQRVRNAAQLRNQIGAKAPGTPIKLLRIRDGKEATIEAKLKPIGDGAPVTAPAESSIAGVTFGPIPQDHPLYGKLEGVLVTEVARGSAAAEADIEPGDIILSADQKPVGSPQDLAQIVEAVKDKPLLLHMRRGDGERFVVIR